MVTFYVISPVYTSNCYSGIFINFVIGYLVGFFCPPASYLKATINRYN